MFAWWICPLGRIRFSPPAPHLMSYPCLVHQKRVSCTADSIQNVLLAPWTYRCEKPCAPKIVSSWQRLSLCSRCDQIRSPGSRCLSHCRRSLLFPGLITRSPADPVCRWHPCQYARFWETSAYTPFTETLSLQKTISLSILLSIFRLIVPLSAFPRR